MDGVHLAITRRVKPGCEEEFSARLQQFARESLHEPGTTGVHLIEPVPDSDGAEFGILRSFVSNAACHEFYRSARYRDWERSVAPLVVGPSIRRPLHGLEAFFRESGRAAPPRWKMAIVTWLGVYPTALFWSTLFHPSAFSLRGAVLSACSIALTVATLTWFIMPLLTRLFRRWLQARGSIAGRSDRSWPAVGTTRIANPSEPGLVAKRPPAVRESVAGP